MNQLRIGETNQLRIGDPSGLGEEYNPYYKCHSIGEEVVVSLSISLALAMPDEETLREIDALPASPPRFHFEEGHPGLMPPSPTSGSYYFFEYCYLFSPPVKVV